MKHTAMKIVALLMLTSLLIFCLQLNSMIIIMKGRGKTVPITTATGFIIKCDGTDLNTCTVTVELNTEK